MSVEPPGMKDDKFRFYYGAYNYQVHYKPSMEFDLKDMSKIMGEDGNFTGLESKKTEWERIMEFVLNTDKTKFEFYLTLLNLGL